MTDAITKEATPRPWRLAGKYGTGIETRAGVALGFFSGPIDVSLKSDGANAALAVHAVNTFEEREARLTALEAENARLREALKPFADEAFRYEPDENDGFFNAWDSTFSIGDLRRARKALNGE